MGSSVSCHSNLGNDCTYFEAGLTYSVARWGSYFEVEMSATREEDDHTDFWRAEYKLRNQNKERHTCDFSLTASRDDDGVKSIIFALYDYSAENKTDVSVEITRTARYALRGGIINFSCFGGLSKCFTRDEENHSSVETRIVSYGGSNSLREGLFVLEMKKFFNSNDAYMVTLAHYYVTHERGLSVTAKILRKGNCIIDVEVEGPFKHPSADLRKVLVKTCRTGVWSPNASSHCSRTNTRFSNSSLIQESPERGYPPKAPTVQYYLQGLFNIFGGGNKNYTGANIIRGENSGNRYNRYTYDNHGGNSINNSGTFIGNGNSGSIDGNFDVSTMY